MALKHRIDEIYTDYPFYGSRRIREHLVQYDGLTISRKTVQRHMQDGDRRHQPWPQSEPAAQGACCLSVPAAGRHQQPPQSGLGIDITYIRLQKQWLYLVAVLDWYSRYVISWPGPDVGHRFRVGGRRCSIGASQANDLEQRPRQPFHQPAVHRTATGRRGAHQHGWQGRALDNIFTERLWRTLKYEEVYLHDYVTPKDACHGLQPLL